MFLSIQLFTHSWKEKKWIPAPLKDSSTKPCPGFETGDLLGFDLLLGMDAIKQLGGVTVTGTGEVTFPQCDRPNCAAITITESDFNAEYDKITQRWTASWKWVGDQPPVTLRNRLAEYPAPAQIREEYLQVHVNKSLWPFQTVEIKRQIYHLTHLGFGLNVAPLWSKG